MSQPVSPGSTPQPTRHDGRLVVTIDGPAGTGKSSTARVLAKRLGVDFLDTGAMYRAAAALVIDAKVDPRDTRRVCEIVEKADLHFDWSKDPPELQASGVSLMSRIRALDVTAIVSPLAGIPELRRHMVRKQQLIGKQHPKLVTEGRDQGSVVFPDADVKFYLDAKPEVRAARRAEQLRAAGVRAEETILLTEIKARDLSDSSRTDGPLVCPVDAQRVDTSGLTFDQVVDQLEQAVRRHLASRPA